MLSAQDIVNCARTVEACFHSKDDSFKSSCLEVEFYGEDTFFERDNVGKFGLYEQHVMEFTGDNWIMYVAELLSMSDMTARLKSVVNNDQINDFDRIIAEMWLEEWCEYAPSELRPALEHPSRLSDREIIDVVGEIIEAENDSVEERGKSLFIHDPDEIFFYHGMHFMQFDKKDRISVASVCFPAGGVPSDGFSDWSIEIPERKFKDLYFMKHLLTGLMGDDDPAAPSPCCTPRM